MDGSDDGSSASSVGEEEEIHDFEDILEPQVGANAGNQKEASFSNFITIFLTGYCSK